MIEKRYQIFISSTFRDLIDERQAVLKAVLELDHMPAGMELFPAADDTAWQLIKDVIDSSDYYVLLIGGRYGSLDEEGLGYTEKEYDYATRKKKPVIPLLHKSPDNLPRERTETEPGTWKKLEAFRAKVEKKHTCVYWDSAEDLKAKVIVGLTANVKRHPTVGWVRADNVPSDATVREVLALRKQIAALEDEINQIRTDAPPGTEDLMQDDDLHKMAYSFTARPPRGSYADIMSYESTMSPSWNEIFAGVSPVMINEASERDLRRAFHKHFEKLARQDLAEEDGLRDHYISDVKFSENDIETCLVQLRALGLIKESDRKRSVKDTSTYWTLTPYGDRMMVQLRALRRDPPAKRSPGAKPEVVAAETE
ncbi:DUF4062 domain-containing protein [Roseiconus lacunae]|uniref:DUF4062 domain-containing protein n=1 Tax=Roseiconus lacunae TaxID=2605694 RepID=UPI001E337DC0|nr:DUF4062 domain-containing protein [Roseiconus lacunae]MCD0459944.1 DUF4062 domain-containing protein [Roseiconus lacunae]